MGYSHQRKRSNLYLQKNNSSMHNFQLKDMELNDAERAAASNKIVDLESSFVNDDIETTYSADDTSWTPTHFRTAFGRKQKLISAIFFFIIVITTVSVLFGRRLHLRQSATDGTNILHDRRFTIENVLDGEFYMPETSFHFIQPPNLIEKQQDDIGLYYTVEYIDDRDVIVAKLFSNPNFRKIVTPTKFLYNGIDYEVMSVKISYQLDTVIIGTNISRKFRHSTIGQYFIHKVGSNTYTPISPEKSVPINLSYAYYSPAYTLVYFNYQNNLYVQSIDSEEAVKVTSSGSSDVLNAKTDWIYEEEVLASDQAIWWSTDDSKAVYAQLNETGVTSYSFPKYIVGKPYPEFEDVKYPKPGYQNPTIKLFVLDAKINESHLIDIVENGENLKSDFILYDGIWVGPNAFLFKVTDRTSKIMKVKVYDAKNKRTVNAWTLDARNYGGWIEKMKKMFVIPPKGNDSQDAFGYLNVQPDENGYNHIFYYPSAFAQKGKQLTKGPWEITGNGILGYQQESNTIYFTANKQSRMSQNIYAVKLDNTNPEDIMTLETIDSEEVNYFDYELSPSCKYAMKRKNGNISPYTIAGLFNDVLQEPRDFANVWRISRDDKYQETLAKYDMPEVKYQSMIMDDGVQIDYIQILPKNWSSKKQYPLLVNIYAGPGTLTFTSKNFSQFEQAVVSGLDAIVLQIEPRGTGGKGWKYKSWATQKLGYWEPRDITELTKKYIQNNEKSIDEEKVAIWGWSYGGFTTLKTVELDMGATFKYAMAVAPVTDWLLYDSIYTERHMDTPAENSNGYAEISIIKNVDSFDKLKRFLLVHGTADENVHIQNSYRLYDMLNLANIGRYDVQIYPDSDHSISTHNAMAMVYKKLYNWLDDAFTGQFLQTQQI